MLPSLNEGMGLSGVGIGLRSPHLSSLLDEQNPLSQSVPWLEILADNYLDVGGLFAAHLSALAERYPLTFHCVGMSIGSPESVNVRYLTSLKRLADKHNPRLISDHLSWSNFKQERSHDLLPLCYTDNSLARMIKHVNQVQDILERPLMLENVSAYYAHPENALEEADFIHALCDATGCYILLDLNNLYVNHKNLDYDIHNYLKKLPIERIKQLHLGGHEARGDFLVDTHGAAICDEVWSLYQEVISHFGPIPTLIEWDNNVPAFEDLMQERNKADFIIQAASNTYSLSNVGTTSGTPIGHNRG